MYLLVDERWLTWFDHLQVRRICRFMIKKEMKNERHENVWPAAAAVYTVLCTGLPEKEQNECCQVYCRVLIISLHLWCVCQRVQLFFVAL